MPIQIVFSNDWLYFVCLRHIGGTTFLNVLPSCVICPCRGMPYGKACLELTRPFSTYHGQRLAFFHEKSANFDSQSAVNAIILRSCFFTSRMRRGKCDNSNEVRAPSSPKHILSAQQKRCECTMICISRQALVTAVHFNLYIYQYVLFAQCTCPPWPPTRIINASRSVVLGHDGQRPKELRCVRIPISTWGAARV